MKSLDFEEIENKKLQQQDACSHFFWVKKCSTCGKILDNDKLHEHKKIKEIVL